MKITIGNYEEARALFRGFCEKSFGVSSPEWLSEMVLDHIAERQRLGAQQHGLLDYEDAVRQPSPSEVS